MYAQFKVNVCLVLFTIVLLKPTSLFSQYENLKLQNAQFYFEKTYLLDSMDKSEVEQVLLNGVPKLKDLTEFNKAPDIITAKIINTLIDYRKFGGKWGNTSAILNHPFYGDVTVVWKDGKYKVTITNMYFNADGLGLMKCDDLFTKSRGTVLKEGDDAVKTGRYIDLYLSDLFSIKPISSDW
jgi:hypothetical protein